jgi:NarL family two-component system response regulator YdfI
MKRRVLIADDHRLIAEGIKRSLEESDGFEVVGEASSGSQVMPLVRRTTPDLVLLDLRMPGLDGLSALELIKRDHSEIKVVILSASADPTVIQSALARGASAYILKSVNPIDLAATLRQAMEGNVFHAVGLPEAGQPTPAAELGLTAREIGIIQALARGLSNQAIGKELFVAEQTVKFHLTNIYRKLDAANRTEAVRLAYQRGIIDNPLYDD